MLRQHPRAAHVQQFGFKVARLLDAHRKQHTDNDAQMLLVVHQIIGDSIGVVLRQPPSRRVRHMRGLDQELVALQAAERVTTRELLRILIEYSTTLATNLVRLERHPSRPGKGADEA